MRASDHPFRRRYQLSDVWNAAKTERNFDYSFWGHIVIDVLMEHAISIFGKVLVVLATVLIVSLISSGYFIILPNVSSPDSIWFYLHASIGRRNKFLFGIVIK